MYNPPSCIRPPNKLLKERRKNKHLGFTNNKNEDDNSPLKFKTKYESYERTKEFQRYV